MSLAPRDRRALRLGLALVGPMAVWVLGVRPYRAALTEVRDRLAAEHSLLARERALLASGRTLEDAVRRAGERLSVAGERLLRSDDPTLAEAELTRRLEGAAAMSRVLLEEVRSVATGGGVDPAAALTPVRLSLRGESDLEGLLAFLWELERGPPLVRVVELSAEPVAAGGGAPEAAPGPVPSTGVVTFTLVLESYTWSAEAAGPAGGTEENPE